MPVWSYTSLELRSANGKERCALAKQEVDGKGAVNYPSNATERKACEDFGNWLD